MTRIEGGIRLPERKGEISVRGEKVTRDDVFSKFGFDFRPIVMERLKCWKILPEVHRLNFFDIAQRHESSSSLYLLEEIIGDSWVFVQAMLEQGKSTRHKHKDEVFEIYDLLAGRSILEVDGKKQNLGAKTCFVVLPGQVHQLKTEDYSCLNLLIMRNSAHIPRNELHIPVT